MTTDVANGSKSAPIVPAALGALSGVIAFLSLVLWFGLPVIPNTNNLPSILKDVPSPYASLAAPAGPTDPGEQTYQAICAACHQATGNGLPGAFPPLAGSEWANGDPETMIRIVIAGLQGPVTVKGQQFNSMMPPPPGLDDDKIAHVLTFVRANFGNKASKVEKEQVAAVRTQLAGRSKPWTAEELKALQKPGEGGDKPAEPAAQGTPTPGGPKAIPSPTTPSTGPVLDPTPKDITPVKPTIGPAGSATAVPPGTKPPAPK